MIRFVCILGRQITLSSTGKLDYETLSRYNISFTISDGKSTNGPYVLTVNVVNVNEDCYFDRQIYYVSVLEGVVGNQYNNNLLSFTFQDIRVYCFLFMSVLKQFPHCNSFTSFERGSKYPGMDPISVALHSYALNL
jgi:hypothetical protein